MIEIILSVIAIWLFFKTIGLTVKITWGIAKVIATVLLVLAAPIFILCLVCSGGFGLLMPIALLLGAAGIVKSYF